MTSTTTLAFLNVYRKNSAELVEGDLHQLVREHEADLIAVNEASSPSSDPGTDAFVKRMAWQAYQPGGADELGILWNPDVWKREPLFGVRRISDRGPVDYLPGRQLIWQGLYHRPSKTRHLVYCTHITQGYAKDEPMTHEGWRDHAARTALLRVAATTANHMAEHDEYRYHHLLGDLNARQNNRDEWWYPHPLLEAGFVRDTMPKSIDYMLHSHMAAGAGLHVVKRAGVGKGIDSDHAAQVKRIKLP